jgi:NAD-dependent SIR2 family protein deacetylase
LSLAAKWLKDATDVLIAGGAGLSASAGLDYTSEDVFRRLYPAMHKRGFRNMYQFIGYTDWSPALQWGYLLPHCHNARFNWHKNAVYVTLQKILQSKLSSE